MIRMYEILVTFQTGGNFPPQKGAVSQETASRQLSRQKILMAFAARVRTYVLHRFTCPFFMIDILRLKEEMLDGIIQALCNLGVPFTDRTWRQMTISAFRNHTTLIIEV